MGRGEGRILAFERKADSSLALRMTGPLTRPPSSATLSPQERAWVNTAAKISKDAGHRLALQLKAPLPVHRAGRGGRKIPYSGSPSGHDFRRAEKDLEKTRLQPLRGFR